MTKTEFLKRTGLTARQFSGEEKIPGLDLRGVECYLLPYLRNNKLI